MSDVCRDKRCFLADAQHRLSVYCCRVLARLATFTDKSFLFVGGRGCSPSCDGGSTKRANETASDGVFNMHEEAYRSVRSSIAASCTLGHRSCHVLWGPRGCGKHRILRLVALECMQRNGTFVLMLDGDTLNSDEEGLRSIASQLLEFLKSPQSSQLRAADLSLRTGTFNFGKLFGFSKHLQQSEVVDDDTNGPDKGGSVTLETPELDTVKGQKKAVTEHRVKRPKIAEKRARSPSIASSQSDNGSNSEDISPLLLTSTDACVTGGVTSALPALQRVLLLMKSHGANFVVCIRRLERFGVWCDQLLYLLSGLMHESDVRGGGMSLLMTSSTPDIRHLEKRLSSRLTCETRCIPLLPWTVTRVVRACLLEVKEHLQQHVNGRVVSGGCNEAECNVMTGVPSSVIGLEQVVSPLTGWRFDVFEAMSEQKAELDEGKRSLDLSSDVFSSSNKILEEAMLEMVITIIAELNAAKQMSLQLLDDTVFAERITLFSAQLKSIGATAGRVVAAVHSFFAEVCSGRLKFFNDSSCASIFFWLTFRLKKKRTNIKLCSTFVTAPMAVRERWLLVPLKRTSRNTGVVTAPSTSPFFSSSDCQLMFDDLLADCRLVKLGYCSRETFLILVYVYLRHDAGVVRTVVDLLEDVASSMGTQAAAALDRSAFYFAIAALHRWQILSVAGRGVSAVVSLCGSPARLQEFLQSVLSRGDYCASVLGLEAREITRLRNLL